MSNQALAPDPATSRPGAGVDYDKFLDCVHCGLCTSACPTYVETGNENDGPRGRIYLMRSVADGRLELTSSVRRHLELCLDCRACETACPSGVQYGRLIEPFRIEMEHHLREGQAAKTSDWFHRLVLFGILPYPKRTRIALAPARALQWLRLDRLLERLGVLNVLPARLRSLHRLLPPRRRRQSVLPELFPAHGNRRARVALLTGCVADVLFRHTHWATARVLQANGCDVVVPRDQVCCGAIQYHSGAEAPAREWAAKNCRLVNPDDFDAIITNVAGCGAMLKDYGELFGAGDADDQGFRRFADKVRDVSEFLVELGPVAPQVEVPLRATYHDACHLAHAQQIRDQPRQLLKMVPGLELVPLAESELCCGAAGTYNLTEPEMAGRLARRKLDNILATGADAVLCANAGCLLQIDRALRDVRSPVWVAHPVEVLDRSYSQGD